MPKLEWEERAPDDWYAEIIEYRLHVWRRECRDDDGNVIYGWEVTNKESDSDVAIFNYTSSLSLEAAKDEAEITVGGILRKALIELL